MLRRLCAAARRGETGQVLVIFALGSLVFLGMLALAIDVGTMYVERRQAQNAADATALVGAQHSTGGLPQPAIAASSAVAAAREYAVRNGFSTSVLAGNGVWDGEVWVSSPPQSGAFAGDTSCIEVAIRKSRDSLFGGILGVAGLNVTARAVARCYNSGSEVAVLGLKRDDDSIENMGAGNGEVVGGTFSRGRTKVQGSKMLRVHGTAYARQGFVGANLAADNYVGSPFSDPPPDVFDPMLPAPGPVASSGCMESWDSGGPVEQSTKDANGNLHIQPCTYKFISVRPSDKVIFEPGVYKVTGRKGVEIKGEAHGNGVAFVLPSGCQFEANSQSSLYFESSPAYNHVLIWSQDSGNKAIKINGGANATFEGTLYAPNGGIELDGNPNGLVRGQIIGYQVFLGGTADTKIIYDKSHAAQVRQPTLVE